MISDASLLETARNTLNPKRLSPTVEMGSVASALVTTEGNVYTGVCIDASSGIGFCAEHAAIAAMVTGNESRIATIAAVTWDRSVVSPCGRCREFIRQLHPENARTRVLLDDDAAITIEELLPAHWLDGNGVPK